MKKLLALALSILMVLSLASTAFAADTYSITIENSASGHTYEAYQIFTGDLFVEENGDKVLSNIEWGNGISADGKTKFGDAAAKAETLDDPEDAAAFAKALGLYLGDVAGSDNSVENGEYVITGLTPGYYLVKDKNGSLNGANDAYTSYIIEVVGDATASPKSSVPSVQKKVDDKNDSNTSQDETVWEDSADHDIGDNVPLQLKATLANNVSDYLKYKIVFHDTMSKGLTFNGITKVTVDGNEVTEGYKVHFVKNADGTTSLTVTFENVKAQGAGDSSTVIVEYNAILNEDANIGSLGNPNVVYLEYSNNPNWAWENITDSDDEGDDVDEDDIPKGSDGKDNDGDGLTDETDEEETNGGNDGKDNDGDGDVDEPGENGAGDGKDNDNDGEIDEPDEGGDGNSEDGTVTNEPTGKTPNDKVIVFTYQTIINKVDPDGKALAGAEFVLEKFVASTNGNAEYLGVTGTWTAQDVTVNQEGTVFTFIGIDEGEYRLRETDTPDGYNTIEDIYFTVTATHEINSADPKLLTLTATQKTAEGGDLPSGTVATFKATCTPADGSIESNVVNNKGTVLPETGGMGTTLFYAVGGLLVVAAAILLITKKRMASAE